MTEERVNCIQWNVDPTHIQQWIESIDQTELTLSCFNRHKNSPSNFRIQYHFHLLYSFCHVIIFCVWRYKTGTECIVVGQWSTTITKMDLRCPSFFYIFNLLAVFPIFFFFFFSTIKLNIINFCVWFSFTKKLKNITNRAINFIIIPIFHKCQQNLLWSRFKIKKNLP